MRDYNVSRFSFSMSGINRTLNQNIKAMKNKVRNNMSFRNTVSFEVDDPTIDIHIHSKHGHFLFDSVKSVKYGFLESGVKCRTDNVVQIHCTSVQRVNGTAPNSHSFVCSLLWNKGGRSDFIFRENFKP